MDRKRSYLLLGHNLDLADWDQKSERVKKSHPKAMQLNRLIRKKYDEIEDLIFESESMKLYLTAKQITEQVKGNKKSKGFNKLSEEYLEELQIAKKESRYNSDKSRVGVLKLFFKRDVAFQEIDEAMLKKLKAWLIGSRGISERSVMNYYILIRTLYNRAISERIVKEKFYPFGKGRIQIKFPQSKKVGLSFDEINKITNLDLAPHSGKWHARNVFMFSFYFAGVRISDVLRMRWEDIQDGRLYYQMGKNNKVDSLQVPDDAQHILALYEGDKEQNKGFIFPELAKANLKSSKDVHNKIRAGNRRINNYLAKIAEDIELNKPLSMHIARHSFGNIAGDKISPHMLQKLYRHSNLSTTIGYQGNFIHKKADEALEKVLKGNVNSI